MPIPPPMPCEPTQFATAARSHLPSGQHVRGDHWPTHYRAMIAWPSNRGGGAVEQESLDNPAFGRTPCTIAGLADANSSGNHTSRRPQRVPRDRDQSYGPAPAQDCADTRRSDRPAHASRALTACNANTRNDRLYARTTAAAHHHSPDPARSAPGEPGRSSHGAPSTGGRFSLARRSHFASRLVIWSNVAGNDP